MQEQFSGMSMDGLNAENAGATFSISMGGLNTGNAGATFSMSMDGLNRQHPCRG
jgi:hypothetical protein